MNRTGMIAALMAGEAARGFGAGIKQQRAERGFVDQAATMFQQLGTDEGIAFAQALRENPTAAAMRAKAFGGFEKMYTGMQERAARKSATTALSSFLDSQSGTPITKQEVLTDLLPKLVDSGVPGAMGIAQTLLMGAGDTNESAPPKWFVERILPSNYTPDSYQKAMLYGMQTQDWEGAVSRLKARPVKSPNQLTPTGVRTAKENAILDKNQRAREAKAAGKPDSEIDWVTPAEAGWLNDVRKNKMMDPDAFDPEQPTDPKVRQQVGWDAASDMSADIANPETARGWQDTKAEQLKKWLSR